jgi:hypothetical protein
MPYPREIGRYDAIPTTTMIYKKYAIMLPKGRQSGVEYGIIFEFWGQ